MKQEDLEFYGEFAPRLMEIENLLSTEIQAMLDSISTDSETTLAEHIKCRVKSAESLKEKLRLRGFPITARAGLENLSDLVGARVITHFVGDIYTVLDLIQKNDSWRVVQVKDYIADMKPNGYRSLHVLLNVPFGVGGISDIDVEIQLRTIAMDSWAALEHQMSYKRDIPGEELIRAELKRCADELAACDISMQTIRELIKG